MVEQILTMINMAYGLLFCFFVTSYRKNFTSVWGFNFMVNLTDVSRYNHRDWLIGYITIIYVSCIHTTFTHKNANILQLKFYVLKIIRQI